MVQILFSLPGGRQAINWSNAGILLIRPLGTNFTDILIEILTVPFRKMRFKVSPASEIAAILSRLQNTTSCDSVVSYVSNNMIDITE